MASLEHIFHQSCEVYAPTDTTGDDFSAQTEPSGTKDILQPEKPKFSGIDFGDRDTWNRCVSIVSELQKYGEDRLANHILGLPEDSTRSYVEEYILDQDVVYTARSYGLPDDIPEEVIDELLEKEVDEKFKTKARALGLREDATGNQIYEQEMKLRAQALGLAEDTSYGDIWRAETEQKRKLIFAALGIGEDKPWDWEDVLSRILCLSSSEPADAYVERILEVRKWYIDNLIFEGSKQLLSDTNHENENVTK